MATENTSQLPPCPLTGCEGSGHHYHDVDVYKIGDNHDCARSASVGFRCYGPHRPGLSEPIDLPEVTDEIANAARTAWGLKSSWDSAGDRARRWWRAAAVAVRDALLAGIPQWQPIEHDQIRAGMRIRVTVRNDDRTTVYVGVAHHQDGTRVWYTKERWPLAGWGDSITYEVDPATIPDPDTELIEKIGKAIHDADESAYTWDGLSVEAYRELAQVALAAIRAEEAGEQA